MGGFGVYQGIYFTLRNLFHARSVDLVRAQLSLAVSFSATFPAVTTQFMEQHSSLSVPSNLALHLSPPRLPSALHLQELLTREDEY